MISPLILIFVVHNCVGFITFENGFFGNGMLPIVPANPVEAWGGFPSFSSFPRFNTKWLEDFRTPPIGPSYTFTPHIVPVAVPIIPVPQFPTVAVNKAECEEVSEVKDLAFPPYSDVPTENLKKEDILENIVNKTTYLCKDYNKKEFYLLRTKATFTTINIRNKQDTLNYYSFDKKPLAVGKDVIVNQTEIWEIIDKLDKEKLKTEKEKFQSEEMKTDEVNGSFNNHLSSSLWSKLWPHFGRFEPEKIFPKPDCKDVDYISTLDYPDIEVSSSQVGDEIVSKEVSHKTQFCNDTKNDKKYYMLTTYVTIKTKNGSTVNRNVSIAHAADKDGKPLPRADGATTSVASKVSSVSTSGLPETISQYATYHHQ